MIDKGVRQGDKYISLKSLSIESFILLLGLVTTATL